MTLDTFLPLLKNVTRNASGYMARCPAHDDSTASLSVSQGEKGIVIKCFAGCSVDAIVRALNLDVKDLFPEREKKQIVATYDYRDEAGQLLFQSVRYRLPNGDKEFKQRRPDGKNWLWKGALKGVRTLLYRLPELLAADPAAPVFVVEGEKDAERLATIGAVATCNPMGAGKWRDDYAVHLKGRSVIVIPDNDRAGIDHAKQVAASVVRVAANVVLMDPLPGVPAKGDVSDYLAAGHSLADLLALASETRPYVPGSVDAVRAVAPCTLHEAHDVVRRWFGEGYDLAAFDAMLATMAAERLEGDPVWLLLITGPGGAKTETLSSAAGADAIITSTIASEGALLSGSSKKDRTKDATGGLLRRIGERGVLVIKDVTSILSMHRETRASVLAALREVYDGRWERNLGTNGGMTLTWTGRIAVMGAVTTAWDQAHAVVSSMGDRFVIVRIDSTRGREQAGTHALDNTGAEITMRAELAEIVGRVMAGATTKPEDLTKEERNRLLRAANLVTLCRTAVEFDYQGNVIDAHAPEMPTRFAKQLMQIVRGARAVGVTPEESMNLAIRVARDSMPPLRLQILEAVQTSGRSRVGDVRADIDKPWMTVRRQLEALHILRVLTCEEEERDADEGQDDAASKKRTWWYALAHGIYPAAISLSPEKSGYGVVGGMKNDHAEAGQPPAPDKSGEGKATNAVPF